VPDTGNEEAALVVNTQSRRGQRLYGKAKSELARRGIPVRDSFPVRDASRLSAVVQEVLAQGYRFMIVGGGDGTVSSVASVLADRNIRLGLLPMGTANNFARANRIPLALSAAVEVLASGREASVDLGRIDGVCFTNAVSVGISSAVHRGSPDPLKRHFGRVGYLMAAAREVAAFRGFACRLRLDGVLHETAALDVRIANGPFQGGLRVVEGAGVESGDLAVRVIKGPSKWAYAGAWARFATGRRADPGAIETFRARDIEIDTDPPQFVSVDGEVMRRTPARVTIVPAALRLMVPRLPEDGPPGG